MIEQKKQIGGISDLEYLIAQKDLKGNLNAFLLSCKVDELSLCTIEDYSLKVGAFVKFCTVLGVATPNELTTQHIRLFLLKLQETCQAISVSDYCRCVKRFLNWMVVEGILQHSPALPIRPPRVPRKLVIPFTPRHIQDLLSLCNDNKFLGARNKAIILVFLDTGLRLKELSDIQIRDMDFDREIIKVMGKGARERIVRIGKRAQKALLRYLLMRNDNYPNLWVSEERRPLTARGIDLAIRKLGKRLGFKDVRCSCHTFRHTFGTSALRNKADIREVQSLLGHSTLTMTLRYVQTVNSEDAIISHRKWSPADTMSLK